MSFPSVFSLLEHKSIGMHAPIIFVCPNQGTLIRHWELPFHNPRVVFPGKHINVKRHVIKRLDDIRPYHRFVRHSESPYNNMGMRFPVRYVNVKRLMPKPCEETKWVPKKDETPQDEVRDRLGMRNVLERQRRNDLKSRLNVLRQNIPELVNNNDAPQVLILNKAVDYLRELKLKEKKLMLDIALEKSRKLYLLERIQDLLMSFPSHGDVKAI